MQYRHILHATDYSRVSAAAFHHALTLARQHRSALTLVHVMPEVLPTMAMPEIGAATSAETYETIRTAARRDAEASMEKLVDAARHAGVRARVRILEGVAHERIVQAARRDHADLIVMGTHGRSGLSRWFLGSVAARVIAAAPCPVLTVRAATRVPVGTPTRRRARQRAA